jgi:predicted small metal-binding protein
LINDLTYYKSDDIYKIYKNLLSTDISGEIEYVISNHIELMHNPDSLITKINENIIDTNFENINESWF